MVVKKPGGRDAVAGAARGAGSMGGAASWWAAIAGAC
jgi:hypothetical protein